MHPYLFIDVVAGYDGSGAGITAENNLHLQTIFETAGDGDAWARLLIDEIIDRFAIGYSSFDDEGELLRGASRVLHDYFANRFEHSPRVQRQTGLRSSR